MTDWIEHDGKSRPNLPHGALVYTRQSNGYSDEHCRDPVSWEWWDEPDDQNSSWLDDGSDIYIVAYRVVTK